MDASHCSVFKVKVANVSQSYYDSYEMEILQVIKLGEEELLLLLDRSSVVLDSFPTDCASTQRSDVSGAFCEFFVFCRCGAWSSTGPQKVLHGSWRLQRWTGTETGIPVPHHGPQRGPLEHRQQHQPVGKQLILINLWWKVELVHVGTRCCLFSSQIPLHVRKGHLGGALADPGRVFQHWQPAGQMQESG